MVVKVKQKSREVIMIRTNPHNPMEQDWVLQHWAMMKQGPKGSHPEISVKNMKNEEINLPKPQMMTVKPQEVTIVPPINNAPESKQFVLPDNGSQIPSPPADSGSKPISEPPNNNTVEKIAQNIAIGEAADKVEQMVKESKPIPSPPDDEPQPIIIEENVQK